MLYLRHQSQEAGIHHLPGHWEPVPAGRGNKKETPTHGPLFPVKGRVSLRAPHAGLQHSRRGDEKSPLTDAKYLHKKLIFIILFIKFVVILTTKIQCKMLENQNEFRLLSEKTLIESVKNEITDAIRCAKDFNRPQDVRLMSEAREMLDNSAGTLGAMVSPDVRAKDILEKIRTRVSNLKEILEQVKASKEKSLEDMSIENAIQDLMDAMFLLERVADRNE